MRTSVVIVAVCIGTVGGYALALYSYISTGEFVTWTALLGLGIGLQAQLGGIWFLLGKILGRLNRQ